MTRPARWRQRAKWAALALTAATALTWFVSGWQGVAVQVPITSRLIVRLTLGGGQLGLAYESWVNAWPRRLDIWRYAPSPYTPRWFSRSTRFELAGTHPALARGSELMLPIWPAIPALAAAAACLWFLDRRRPAGACRRCGYDLAGIPSARCPECGAARTDEKPTERASSPNGGGAAVRGGGGGYHPHHPQRHRLHKHPLEVSTNRLTSKTVATLSPSPRLAAIPQGPPWNA